ncbi:GNAT family N-acetyltransferase [Cohnella yongneupensis]|uniref:GNAT family N-acetyltransferase n=1 Tax=Cohnella yongneupensis TaxID=425006 RepID=A0ABW0QTH7_9BACL
MLIDLKSRLQDSEIQELIGWSVFPDPDSVPQVIEQYAAEDSELSIMGYESEEQMIGFVGFSINSEDRMVLRHIAVLPEARGAGFGRGMILELLHQFAPNTIEAETDEEAVHFYRSIGFRVESLGERVPGTERFLCTYEAYEQED